MMDLIIGQLVYALVLVQLFVAKIKSINVVNASDLKLNICSIDM